MDQTVNRKRKRTSFLAGPSAGGGKEKQTGETQGKTNKAEGKKTKTKSSSSLTETTEALYATEAKARAEALQELRDRIVRIVSGARNKEEFIALGGHDEKIPMAMGCTLRAMGFPTLSPTPGKENTWQRMSRSWATDYDKKHCKMGDDKKHAFPSSERPPPPSLEYVTKPTVTWVIPWVILAILAKARKAQVAVTKEFGKEIFAQIVYCGIS